MKRAKRILPASRGYWPRLRPAFPGFPLRPPKNYPSYPPASRLARLGLPSALLFPALGLLLLWPVFFTTPVRPLPRETGEAPWFRLDPGLLTNRGGRPPDLDLEASATLGAIARPTLAVYLHLRGTSYQLETSGATLREGLAQAGIFLKASDLVRPHPDSPLRQGTHAYLQEALPLVVYADGGIASGYTLRPTVGQALADLEIHLRGKDRVQPSLESAITGPTTVRVIRVAEEMVTEEVVVEHQVLRQASDELEIDTQAVAQEGEDGLFKRTIRIAYENGQEVSRTLEREWMEKEPVPRVILYGTRVIWRTVDTPSGPVKYWRKLPLLATWYDASQGGKPRGHPAYGITYTGMVAGRGVVAVDPRVIPLYTRLYVPGYGLAVAGDTGSGIIGSRIDLGFEEGEPVPWWTRWVDVYVLN